jgi:hypothetical protein
MLSVCHPCAIRVPSVCHPCAIRVPQMSQARDERERSSAVERAFMAATNQAEVRTRVPRRYCVARRSHSSALRGYAWAWACCTCDCGLRITAIRVAYHPWQERTLKEMESLRRELTAKFEREKALAVQSAVDMAMRQVC